MARKLIIGCGYVGQRVAQRWLAQGDEVWAVTRSSQRAAEWAASQITPIVGDVLRPADWPDLPAFDVALWAVGLDRTAGHSQREVYVDGLRQTLARFAPRFAQFLYLSSTSVYGQNDGSWVSADSTCDPISDSGRVCLAAEQVVREFFPAERTTAHLLRLAGIYGPQRLIARVQQLKAGEPLKAQPDGWLNLIHVDDIVTAIAACEHSTLGGETWLICDDRPIPRREYYQLLAELIGAPAPRYGPVPAAAGEGSGLNKRCSNAMAKQRLNWQPQFPSITEGLPDALRRTS